MACLTPWDKQTARVFDTEGAFHSLFANSEKSGLARDAVLIIRKGGKGLTAEWRKVVAKGERFSVSCDPAIPMRQRVS